MGLLARFRVMLEYIACENIGRKLGKSKVVYLSNCNRVVLYGLSLRFTMPSRACDESREREGASEKRWRARLGRGKKHGIVGRSA